MLLALLQAGDHVARSLALSPADMLSFGARALEIIGVNIVLSGDNAVVIALACRSLPPDKRTWGLVLGAGAAVLLRIVFTLGLQSMFEQIPYVKLVGGLLLLCIAVKLLLGSDDDEDRVRASDNLWGAVRTVAVADMVMSLDNVLAIAAAAKGSQSLIVFGLAVSVPLIVGGAALIMSLLTRYPLLVWAGAALLGWVAAGLICEDGLVRPLLAQLAESPWLRPLGGHLPAAAGVHELLDWAVAALGALFVVGTGRIIIARNRGWPADKASAP